MNNNLGQLSQNTSSTVINNILC